MNKFLPWWGRLCATPERSRVLGTILEGGEITVSKVAADARVSKGLASAFLRELKKAEIISKAGNAFKLAHNERVRQLKRLENLSQLDISPIQRLNPKTVLLYGSWAEGTNTSTSDIDLCVVTEKPVAETDVATVVGILSRKLKTDVHILLLDEKKAASMKQNNPAFYLALVYKSILLEGEPLEA